MSKNPLKQENLGTRCKKNSQCPKIGEILGTGEKSPGSCPNGPGPDGISMSAGTASGLLIVGQLQLIKHVKYQAKDHSGDAGQHHTGELDVSKVHLNAGEAGNEDHGSQGLVPVFAVVHLGIHQDPQAGGADHSIKQEGDPADDRAGDGLDQGRQLSDEGADDGKYGRAGDDLDAVYLGDGHNADVLPIGGGGNGADETRQHGGEIISEQTAVESRFL